MCQVIKCKNTSINPDKEVSSININTDIKANICQLIFGNHWLCNFCSKIRLITEYINFGLTFLSNMTRHCSVTRSNVKHDYGTPGRHLWTVWDMFTHWTWSILWVHSTRALMHATDCSPSEIHRQQPCGSVSLVSRNLVSSW